MRYRIYANVGLLEPLGGGGGGGFEDVLPAVPTADAGLPTAEILAALGTTGT
jgi:hypothetical protein